MGSFSRMHHSHGSVLKAVEAWMIVGPEPPDPLPNFRNLKLSASSHR